MHKDSSRNDTVDFFCKFRIQVLSWCEEPVSQRLEVVMCVKDSGAPPAPY